MAIFDAIAEAVKDRVLSTMGLFGLFLLTALLGCGAVVVVTTALWITVASAYGPIVAWWIVSCTILALALLSALITVLQLRKFEREEQIAREVKSDSAQWSPFPTSILSAAKFGQAYLTDSLQRKPVAVLAAAVGIGALVAIRPGLLKVFARIIHRAI